MEGDGWDCKAELSQAREEIAQLKQAVDGLRGDVRDAATVRSPEFVKFTPYLSTGRF